MVLWEITLGTAYFLGLKRTYRLALKIQRRVVSPTHSKTRQFLHRRTRAIFDMALRVHLNIQHRDLEVGRNLGNWILRWLDRMKPSAQIRTIEKHSEIKKPLSTSSQIKPPGSIGRSRNSESDRHLFSASRNLWPKSFPAVSMMIRPPRPAGTSMTQNRRFSVNGPEGLYQTNMRGGSDGFLRKDIMQWLQRN